MNNNYRGAALKAYEAGCGRYLNGRICGAQPVRRYMNGFLCTDHAPQTTKGTT